MTNNQTNNTLLSAALAAAVLARKDKHPVWDIMPTERLEAMALALCKSEVQCTLAHKGEPLSTDALADESKHLLRTGAVGHLANTLDQIVDAVYKRSKEAAE